MAPAAAPPGPGKIRVDRSVETCAFLNRRGMKVEGQIVNPRNVSASIGGPQTSGNDLRSRSRGGTIPENRASEGCRTDSIRGCRCRLGSTCEIGDQFLWSLLHLVERRPGVGRKLKITQALHGAWDQKSEPDGQARAAFAKTARGWVQGVRVLPPPSLSVVGHARSPPNVVSRRRNRRRPPSGNPQVLDSPPVHSL